MGPAMAQPAAPPMTFPHHRILRSPALNTSDRAQRRLRGSRAWDEASSNQHARDRMLPVENVEALEQIDQHIVRPLEEALQSYGDHRILVTPDHPTPCTTKKHSHGSVPLLIAGTGIEADEQHHYSEVAAESSDWFYPKGWDMMDEFIKS